jgi:hypothetical protein
MKIQIERNMFEMIGVITVVVGTLAGICRTGQQINHWLATMISGAASLSK